jgi:hypothetical protein
MFAYEWIIVGEILAYFADGSRIGLSLKMRQGM